MPKWSGKPQVFHSTTFGDYSHDDESWEDKGADARRSDHMIQKAVLSGLLELRHNMWTEMARLEALLANCLPAAEVPAEIDLVACHGTHPALHLQARGSSWASRGAIQKNTCSSEDSANAVVHQASTGSHLSSSRIRNAVAAEAGWGDEGAHEVAEEQSDPLHKNRRWDPAHAQLGSLTSELQKEDEEMRERASSHTDKPTTTSSSRALRRLHSNRVDHDLTPLQEFTRSRPFEYFFALMIVANSIFLAVQVQYNAEHVGSMTEPLGFKCISHVFNVVFLLELLIRLAAEGFRGFYCTKHNFGWAALDTVVVTVSVLHLAFDVYDALDSIDTNDNQFVASNMRVLRMVRMAKILRTFRALKLIRFMSALQTLLFSIFVTLKSLAWASVLMSVVIYVFAITFCQCAADGLAELQESGIDTQGDDLLYYWGNLSHAMHTLFQTMSNGISWRPAYEALAATSWVCGSMFVLFIGFAYFVMLNVITGVFCNSAIESARKNPELIAHSLLTSRRSYIRNLSRLFQAFDTDNSGTITMTEFEELLKDELAHAHFQALELNISDAWTLFKLIDEDGSGTIEISEFLTGCEALKGGARTIDVASILYESRIAHRKLFSRLIRVEAMLLGIFPEAERPELFRALPSMSSSQYDEELPTLDRWTKAQ